MTESLLQTSAWVLEKSALEVVDRVISAHLEGRTLDVAQIEGQLGRKMRNEKKEYTVVDGVAVIPVHGVIGKRFNMFTRISGGVSTQLLQNDIEDALTDPDVVALVLDADSPGGTVDGTVELGDWLLQSRGVKPIITHVSGNCCSGMLWLASCAGEIHATRASNIGSLSAVCCHYDVSGKDEKEGVRRTFITSGEYKRIANDAEPLTEKGEAYLQHFIDRYHAMFVEAVAQGRGMSPAEVQKKFGDGRIHLADEALGIGMIDAVCTLEQTIDAARDAAAEEDNMNKEEFAAKYPDLHASLIDEGRQAAQDEFDGEVKTQVDSAVAAENERIFGLVGALFGEQRGAAFAKMAASGLTVDQLQGLEACGFSAAQGGQEVAGGDDSKTKILEQLERDGEEIEAGAKSGPTDFMAQVDAYVKDKRVTRAKAVIAVAKQYPELHEEYKKQQGGGQ